MQMNGKTASGTVEHRWEIAVERETTIVLPGSGLRHTMLQLLRHPDGALYMNAHALGLYRSDDNAGSWTRIPLEFPDAGPNQDPGGLGIGRDGRLWVVHQTLYGREQEEKNWLDLFVSSSADGGQTWQTTAVDWAGLAPGGPADPYAQVSCAEALTSFLEHPDGTLMFSLSLRYPDWNDYLQSDQTRPGVREVMLRSTDGGRTWGDPTVVHQHAAETDYAVDPADPDHILAMTRKQRMLLPGEERAAVEKETGCPPGYLYPWKGGLLLESDDGGRSFREVPDSYTGFGAHRGTILWTERGVVVVVHSAATGLVARISLDGARTWLTDAGSDTPCMSLSRKYELIPNPPGFSYTTPTLELDSGQFLTVYCSRGTESISPGIYGLFWHLTERPAEPVAVVTEPAPMTIGQEKQLFIDDYVVDSLAGVCRTLNQPVKHAANPVLPAVPASVRRWDADMLLTFGSVIFDEDEDVFKMWYGAWGKDTPDHETVLAYATSDDGIAWRKPSLGLFLFRNTLDNNIVLDREGISSGVLKDMRETDPAKRYKMLYVSAYMRICAAFSADGVHWRRYEAGLPVLFHPPGHDGHAIHYWDELLGKYVAVVRDRSGRITDVREALVTDEAAGAAWRKLWGKNSPPENHSIRRVGQAESDDFVHWTPMRVIVGADADDPLNRDNFYNMEVMQYAGMRIGLMTVFSYDDERPRGAVQMTYSRDGRTWQRAAGRAVFLPLSERPGDFDWGSIYPVQGPLVVGDEIWIYYTGVGADHNHALPPGVTDFANGIGLAKLRLDGFMSVDAGPCDGTLTTKPLSFKGGRLVINANAESGRIAVEILDAGGKPIAGLGAADGDALTADALRHTVTWQGDADVKRLEGRPVRLRFHLNQAKLFSFGFSE